METTDLARMAVSERLGPAHPCLLVLELQTLPLLTAFVGAGDWDSLSSGLADKHLTRGAISEPCTCVCFCAHDSL